MSIAKHETISDIVDEMRECADRMEKRGLFDLRGCGTDYLRALADLLEAAATREREAGAAAAQICGEVGEMIGREAALSAPPRNCDVGTAEEQAARFHSFCKSNKQPGDVYSCDRCRLNSIEDCELAWAQMPYEAGGAE